MEITDSYFLYPSALFTTQKPYYISTILGSCVAVCLWDTKLKYGGMCHYMLPLWNGEGLASPKYGNIAIEKLIEKILLFGSKKENMIAKIFGGGDIFQRRLNQFNIGDKNIWMARNMLSDQKISIISSSVGGELGRKIIFNTLNGEVKHRFIKKQLDPLS
jgi:chemotaxis protein CheD